MDIFRCDYSSIDLRRTEGPDKRRNRKLRLNRLALVRLCDLSGVAPASEEINTPSYQGHLAEIRYVVPLNQINLSATIFSRIIARAKIKNHVTLRITHKQCKSFQDVAVLAGEPCAPLVATASSSAVPYFFQLFLSHHRVL
jgi:hypothetical protein